MSSCLIIGDSIAAGIAAALSTMQLNACDVRAKTGASVEAIVSMVPSTSYGLAIVSAGSRIGVGGAVLGVLLYAFIADPIARATADSWRWPERMATRVLNNSGLWEAGQESWRLIVAASPPSDANRGTVQEYREQAEKAKKPVRCTIEVKGEAS